jgi:hypothetical protein
MILTGETGVLGEKHYTACVVGGWMSMEQWRNDTDRETESLGHKPDQWSFPCPLATDQGCTIPRPPIMYGANIFTMISAVLFPLPITPCIISNAPSSSKPDNSDIYRSLQNCG